MGDHVQSPRPDTAAGCPDRGRGWLAVVAPLYRCTNLIIIPCAKIVYRFQLTTSTNQ